MGKVIKGIGKGIKGAVKGVGKVVKKAAKAVKKVATSIGKGLDKLTGGAFGKIMGKLGPIGSIALGFILPGIGSALGGMWSTAATAMTGYTGFGSGFITAAGKAMQFASNFTGKVSGFISDTIGTGLKKVGGTIADGADYIFKGAQEFLGSKNPSSISDVGQWVTNKAKELNPFKAAEAPIQEGMFSSAETGFGVQNQSMFPQSGDALAKYDMVTPINNPVTGQSMGNAMASPSPYALDAPKMFTPPASTGALSTSANPSMVGSSFLSPQGVTGGSITSAAGSSLLSNVLKAGSQLLGQGQGQQAGYQGYGMPDFVEGNFMSDRGGIGGQGSAGGDFLSEQQRMAQQILARQLEQLA
jgi:hypothetical protein